MCPARASILCQVATSSTDNPIAGTIAQISSPVREASGTNSDLVARRAAKVDRSIAISAMTQAAAAIQKIVSASG
jgi:hypothetical protein